MAKTPGVRQRCAPGCPPRCRAHKWAFHVELPAGADGKRRQVTKAGFATAREAAEARAAVMAAHRAGTLPATERRRETMNAYLERWWKAKEPTLRATTVHSYRGHIDKYLIPHLGDVRLADLRRDHIEAMFEAIRRDSTDAVRPVGATTERRILATLRSAVRDAVRAGELAHDHTAHVRLRKAERGRVRPWDAAEFWAFVDRLEAAGDGSAAERLAPIVLVTTGTGMRLGEVCGLRWQDVDLEGGFLVVRQQAQQVGQTVTYGPPKTHSGEDRLVPLAGWVPDTLRAWKARQAAERLALGEAWQDTGLVFTHPDGRGLIPHSLSKAFARQVAAAGARHMRFHDLRHAGATILLSAGVPMPTVSRILGHSSIGITVDTYGHVAVDDGVRAAMDRAMAGFGRPVRAVP